MKKLHVTLLTFLLSAGCAFAQNVVLEGYAFETNNRGYLNEVHVRITDTEGSQTYCDIYSDEEGFFTCELPAGQDYVAVAEKDIFKQQVESFSVKNTKPGEKAYLKIAMKRAPGYLLDVTLSEKFDEEKGEVDAVQGALIELYNNTTEKEELVLKDHPNPTFQYTLLKGNHYTLMIRKKGFFTKRIEAFVDVDGCILCLDGVSKMRPGVSDNLTAGNEMGTLLANIEMERVEVDKAIDVKDIYYDYNSARIKTAAKKELDKLVYLLKTNPSMLVELGSHTDSRGKEEYNQKLSQERAESAVKYITEEGGIQPFRIKAKGYGESELANKCADGVKCSDEEHQQNRRTELKITGVLNNAENNRSLKKIIEEERFEELLQEVLNQEVVEIKEGTEIPEDLKKELAGKTEEESPAAEAKEPVQVVPVKEKIQSEVKKTPPVENEPPTDPFAAAEEAETKTGERVNAGEKDAAVVADTKINVAEVENVRVVSDDYSGFKIEILHTMQKPLLPDHAVFERHGNITTDVVKNEKYSYMLGNYQTYEAADNYMRKTLLFTYPQAKVIQYKDGKRLDY